MAWTRKFHLKNSYFDLEVKGQGSTKVIIYMARSSLTYILGFSVKFFFQPIYTDYTYFDKTYLERQKSYGPDKLR
jgi:hypothetical protein